MMLLKLRPLNLIDGVHYIFPDTKNKHDRADQVYFLIPKSRSSGFSRV